ncbi:helix-turn-helix domain-containing protein [Desulfovibrio sp. OttesenSCG-928-G15]|nr:helix-turn-helix domain-containing protein [Desulfovibrio sp. OttesenSCG-928-G15]
MQNINRLLGIRLKKLREAREQTQNDLAALANISLKNLGELERGRGNPSLKSLTSLAEVLNVSLAELFDFDQEDKSESVMREEILVRLQHTGPDVVRLVHRALKP